MTLACFSLPLLSRRCRKRFYSLPADLLRSLCKDAIIPTARGGKDHSSLLQSLAGSHPSQIRSIRNIGRSRIAGIKRRTASSYFRDEVRDRHVTGERIERILAHHNSWAGRVLICTQLPA